MQQINDAVLFRCDASLQIGAGHVMRCLTLARELFDKGRSITFLTNEGGQQVIERFATHAILVEIRNEMQCELDQLQIVIEKYNIGYMVWDSYEIVSAQEKIISKWIPLMVIDDTYLLPSYSCDAVLNQNIYAESEYYNLSNPDTTILAGSRYVMLREAFRQYKGKVKDISVKVKKLLITFGGSDTDNITLKVLETVEKLRECSLEISVVLGAHYAFEDTIQNFLQTATHHKYRLYRNITTMAELLQEQDFVITASGSTMYELAILGVPSCCIVTADNQTRVAQAFSEHGAAMYGGKPDDLQTEGFVAKLRKIINSFAVRQEMSLSGQRLIDGYGVCRVADYICERMKAGGC